jgi:hypothetical protein
VEYLCGDSNSMGFVNDERRRVRKEVILHLAVSFFELLKNYRVILWLASRFLFLLRNRARLREDPKTIYD